MSKVNRSTYQKVVEENKRLISDIKLLVENTQGIPSAEKILTIHKWRTLFETEKAINARMVEAAKQYIKDHEDELPDFLTNSAKYKKDKS